MREMGELYQKYARQIFQYLMGLCGDRDKAEELTQETFYRAMKTLKNYDGSCKVNVWLCQVAKHIWYQELEKQSKRQAVPLEEHLPSPEASPEEACLLREEKMRLFRELRQLEEPAREVMYLRLTGEFSFREIGELLGREENWARVTFYRAKQKIMKGRGL